MAESRLITISKAELSPNPVQTGKSYVIRATLERKRIGWIIHMIMHTIMRKETKV